MFFLKNLPNLLCIVCLLTSSQFIFSQPNRYADSLLQVAQSHPNDSVKVHAFNQLAFHLVFKDPNQAQMQLNQGLSLAEKKRLSYGLCQLLSTQGVWFDVQGQKDSALHYFNRALQLSRAKQFKEIEVLSLNNLGMYYWGNSQFQEALQHFYQALEINAAHFPHKKESRAKYLNNIGLIYQELQQFDKAIAYHRQSLALRETLQLVGEQAVSLANLAVCYRNKAQYEEAISLIERAIALAEEAGNLRLYYSFHDNLANIYQAMGEYEKAIANYQKSLDRPAELGAYPKSDLNVYANLTSLFVKLNQPAQAISQGEKGLAILAQQPNLRNFSANLLFSMAQANFMLGKREQGLLLMERYKTVQDSVFSLENANAMAEMEKKYEAAEKDLLIAGQQRDLKAKEVRQQKLVTVAIAVVAIMLLILGWVFYRYKRKEADVRQAELNLKLAEQEEINRIHREKLRISRELHDNIGAYLTLLGAKLEQAPVVEHAEDLQNTLSAGMKELRNTVWLLNKQSIGVEELAIKLREFIRPLSGGQTAISIRQQGNSEQKLSDIQTTHVYRIIQEAVNNAVKHAQCTEIQVMLQVMDNKIFSFTVKDNGRGMPDGQHTSGNGLGNMHWRMRELGGVLQINTQPQQGTTVQGTFNLG